MMSLTVTRQTEIYGDEKPLARLRALKEKWDPEAYFNCYNPFV